MRSEFDFDFDQRRMTRPEGALSPSAAATPARDGRQKEARGTKLIQDCLLRRVAVRQHRIYLARLLARSSGSRYDAARVVTSSKIAVREAKLLRARRYATMMERRGDATRCEKLPGSAPGSI